MTDRGKDILLWVVVATCVVAAVLPILIAGKSGEAYARGFHATLVQFIRG